MASELGVLFSNEWKTRLDNNLYKNWLKVGYGMFLTCKGIKCYVDREAKNLHRVITAKGLPPCTCVFQPRRRPNPHHDIICAWANELVRHHTKRKPTWSHSDGSKWNDPNIGYWEIAKLFMPFGCANGKVSAEETDPTGLLNLLQFCSHFKTSTAIVKAFKNIRNMWAHAAKQELTQVETSDAFVSMKDFLNDPELAPDPDAQDALNKVINLEKESMIDYEDVENKVVSCLKDFVSTMKDELDEKLNIVKDQGDTYAKEVKEEISQLKDMLSFCVMADKKRDNMLSDVQNQLETLVKQSDDRMKSAESKVSSMFVIHIDTLLEASRVFCNVLATCLKYFKVFYKRNMILALVFCLLPYLGEPGNEVKKGRAGNDGRICPPCRTNGRWIRVTKEMVESSYEIGVTITYNEVNGGLVINGNVISNGCGHGPGSGAVSYIKGAWNQIIYTQEFSGSASCWKIFGGTAANKYRNEFAFSQSNSLIQVPSNEVQDYSSDDGDAIFNEHQMGNKFRHEFDGRVYRCDNEGSNFWHGKNGDGLRRATVMLRRAVSGGKAGIITETSCGTPSYVIKDIWIFLPQL